MNYRERKGGKAQPSCGINIVYGSHDIEMPLAGYSAEEIQLSLRDVLNVGMEARAYVDGRLASGSCRVRAGERVEFIRDWGRKGIGKTYTKQEFMAEFHMTEVDWLAWEERGLPFDRMKDGTIVLNETEVDRWKEASRGRKVAAAHCAVAAANGMLHLPEVATILGYSPSGMRKLVRKGLIRYFQRGPHSPILFDPQWLEEFKARGTKATISEQPNLGFTPKQRKPKPNKPTLPPPGSHGFNWWKS